MQKENNLKIEKCKIGFREFLIKYKDQFLSKDYSILYGEIDEAKCEIRISTDYNLRQQKATLLHEMMHGLNAMFLNEILKEEHIQILASSLYMTMLDNKELFKELLEG